MMPISAMRFGFHDNKEIDLAAPTQDL